MLKKYDKYGAWEVLFERGCFLWKTLWKLAIGENAANAVVHAAGVARKFSIYIN